ncbi:MAG: hypothetical protein COA91_04720 [Robiginitomaculum sp.]|nr:MAG: hypothetical protein COA91_04720 [Robiginitomaculum sp.]
MKMGEYLMKSLLMIVFIGFVAGAGLAILINNIPALDNMIPDQWETIIIATLVGSIIGLFTILNANKTDNKS